MSRRPDASMDLLKVIREQAMDPGYAQAAGTPGRRWARPATWVALVLVGVMFAISASQTTRAEPQNAQERDDLIARITAARAEQAGQRATLADLEQQTKVLAERLVADPAIRAQLDAVEPVAGARAVTGPGIVVTVDDAPGALKPSQLVTDRDLRQLVNGLWRASAEAIAINGHRLSSRTSIRGAGSAITVDYASLVRPYVVEAIGDPKSLAAKFGQTPGAGWWNSLQSNYGLGFTVRNADAITLGADPGLGLSKAVPVEENR